MIVTPTFLLTAEDLDIILGNAAMDTIVSMLVGDQVDAQIFTKGEWDSASAALQQYELDYVY